MEVSPPVPPFTREAIKKVRAAEDGWNTRDPQRVALAHTEDSTWRNRSEFFEGRAAIMEFLTRKWRRQLEYRLIKEMWTFDADRIASASPMNGTTMKARGFAPTETRTGCSPGTG